MILTGIFRNWSCAEYSVKRNLAKIRQSYHIITSLSDEVIQFTMTRCEINMNITLITY